MLKRQVNALDTRYFSEQQARQSQASDIDPVCLLSHGFHECLGREREDFASVFGFVMSAVSMCLKRSERKVLLCRLEGEQQETGEAYACGLEALGAPASQLLCVNVKKEKDLFWVAEEALSSNALSAVVVIGSYREKLYDFTISRRLKLRSEHAVGPLYFIRNWNQSGATAAHARWRAARRPSHHEQLSAQGRQLIGQTGFSLYLEKPVSSREQSWEFDYDATCGFRLAQPLENRPAGTAEKVSRVA